MIWFDWALLAVIGLSVLVGLWRGFVREVFSIAVWVLAVWVAFRYSGLAAGWLEGWVDLPSARAIIGFVGLLVITLMLGGLAGWLLGKLVDSTGLGGTDRMIGMLFGLLRGLAIIVLLLLVARFTPFSQDPWWQQSRLLPYFERLATYSERWLPENFREMLEQAEDDEVRTAAGQAIEHALDAAAPAAVDSGDSRGNEPSGDESSETGAP